MIRASCVLAVMVVTSTVTVAQQEGRVRLKPGDQAPDFNLEATKEGPYDLTELRKSGKQVIVGWLPGPLDSGG